MTKSITAALTLAWACAATPAMAGEQHHDRSFAELLHDDADEGHAWHEHEARQIVGVFMTQHALDSRKDWGNPLKDWGGEFNHGWHDWGRSHAHGWTNPHCIPAVPEPSSLALLAGGLAVVALRRRRDRRLP